MLEGLRSKYIHLAAPKFKAIYNEVENYINNIIKVKDNKKDIFIKIGGIEFDGTKEQYDDFFTNNDNIHRLINQMIKDVESFFDEDRDSKKFSDMFIID